MGVERVMNGVRRALSAQDEAAPKSPRPRRHILLVEDNPDTREMLGDLLRLLGHRVEAAADGPTGVEMALADPPDLALSDLGFLFRGEVIWEKARPLPEGLCRRPHRRHEGIYIFAKDERHTFATKPPVGSVIWLGKTQARIVRVNDEGFAVEFTRLQHPDFLEENVTGS